MIATGIVRFATSPIGVGSGLSTDPLERSFDYFICKANPQAFGAAKSGDEQLIFSSIVDGDKIAAHAHRLRLSLGPSS